MGCLLRQAKAVEVITAKKMRRSQTKARAMMMEILAVAVTAEMTAVVLMTKMAPTKGMMIMMKKMEMMGRIFKQKAKKRLHEKAQIACLIKR